jgi:hypothetical protein
MSGFWTPPEPGVLGAALARTYRGDLLAVARTRGIGVRVISGASLAALRGRPVHGSTLRYEGGGIEILIADSERGQAFADTLGHEVAHALNPTWSEAECEAFARSFNVVAASSR